jgi:hypothetical protein
MTAADFHAARERLARLNIERRFATGKMREHLDNAAAILQRQLDALAEGLAQEEDMSQQYEYGYTLEVKGERREQVLGVIPADQLQDAQRKADAANRAERMPGLRGAMITPATYLRFDLNLDIQVQHLKEMLNGLLFLLKPHWQLLYLLQRA